MGHVTRMSLTASIGLMALFAVDFIDMLFIASLGNDALAAAVGYAGTLLFFTNSINIGLSIAAGSLVSRAIGAGDTDHAREYATNVAIAAIIVGIAIPALVILNMDALLSLLGASGEAAALAKSYLMIIVPTMSVVGLAMTSMAILRSHGDARRPMIATLIGGCVNAALDPIFIFVLDMGLDGAAVASVMARFSMLAAAMIPAIKVYNGFIKPSLEASMRDFTAVAAIASPAVLTNIATPIGTAVVTREMARFGSDAVAGMAIIGRLTPVAFAVVFALSGAVGPIIGQNYGADQYQRVKDAFFASMKFMGLYVLCITAALFLLRTPIANVFEAEGSTRILLFLFCGPLALSFAFSGAQFVSNAAFNNLGHPMYSTWLNWGKNTIGTWPLVILGALWFGPAGVLIGQAIGTVVFGIVALLLAQKVMNDPKDPLHWKAFWSHRQMHSVTCRRNW
ncbi:MAG: MATE family efflux transporter [Gammaproteobacteria bacterium]|nr:MATE family efflux transporter [Gammaproteobacteria bacterium]